MISRFDSHTGCIDASKSIITNTPSSENSIQDAFETYKTHKQGTSSSQAMNTSATQRAGHSNGGDHESELRRGPWTLEEDSQLIHYIARHGEGRWNMLAKLAGLKRTGKSCRLRWLNYLKPDIKRGNLSPQEQLLILELHSKMGNRWSKIAQHLPGRTDNEIKNYWRTRVQKQARQLNIDSGSKTFLDAVRCFWMPRLLQKMEQNSSNGSSPSITIMNSENPRDFQTMTTSMAPSLSPLLLPPLENHENGNRSSSDATNLSIWQQLPEVSEWPRSPSLAIDLSHNSLCYNSVNDSYFVDSNCYDMGGLNFDPMSTNFENTMDISLFGSHIAESDWVLDNMAGTLWTMDAM